MVDSKIAGAPMLSADAIDDGIQKPLSAATLALGEWLAIAEPRDRDR